MISGDPLPFADASAAAAMSLSALLTICHALPGRQSGDSRSTALLTARRLLYFRQTAAAAVGDARFGDLVAGGDRDHPVVTSCGRTMPATFRMRISWFMRTSCGPLVIRLPFSRAAGDDGGDEQRDLLGDAASCPWRLCWCRSQRVALPVVLGFHRIS